MTDVTKQILDGLEQIRSEHAKNSEAIETLRSWGESVERKLQTLEKGPAPREGRRVLPEGVKTAREILEARAGFDPEAESLVRKIEQEKAAGYDELTLGDLMIAMGRGPRNELEQRALAEGSDSAGGVLVPTITSAMMLDKLRARTVVFQAGAQLVPLTSDETVIPKLTGDPPSEWHTENTSISGGDGPTFSSVTMKAKTLVVGPTEVSVELLEDGIGTADRLNMAFIRSSAVELDRGALRGSGSDPEPEGIVNFSSLAGTVDKAASPLSDFSDLISAIEYIESENAGPVSGFVMAPRTRAELAALTETGGQPLLQPEMVRDVAKYTTTSVPTNLGTGTNESQIIAGNFRNLMIGLRTGLKLFALRGAKFKSNLQITFLAYLRADVKAAYEQSFALVDGIVPAS